jgi:hypothetical protein
LGNSCGTERVTFGVVTVYKRTDGKVAAAVPSDVVGKINGLGYNPAVDVQVVQLNDVCLCL